VEDYTKECKSFIESHREGVEHLLKFGTPTERALLEKIQQIAANA
jgi:hypothetical protein